MSKLEFSYVLMAVAGMTVLGCGSSSSPVSTAPKSGDDLSDSAAVVAANDADSALLALDERRRGRDRDADAGVDDAGVDDDSRGRGPRGRNGRDGRDGSRAGRGAGFERGLEELLAVADLDALTKCQDIQQGCSTSKDADACRSEVEACVRPILVDAFKALCEQRTTECKQDGSSDQACKRVEQLCSEAAHAAKP
jgi:hypothetical protein